ncbi:helix-turn-helix domain-containing protein [Gordonia sp. WA4-43]|uniref:helix-turn-helix domain-containing protein n=1 Tax=Gordonia sp. WA4-43 TaxID=2878678 RepID=UPI001CFBFCEB|nr:helix-turn-helix domain-containing protein [Gordonia sp. WA4-43]UCZ89864.1 helix-turn-helix domain-containing protein [Gordonia sp. WA4-43]
MSMTEDRSELLEVPDIQIALNASRSTVYQLITSNALKTVKVGRRRYTTRRFLAEYIATLEAEAESSLAHGGAA